MNESPHSNINKKIAVYLPQGSKRAEYIVNYILSELLGLQVRFYFDSKGFTDSGMPGLSLLPDYKEPLYLYTDSWLLFPEKRILSYRELEEQWNEKFFPCKESGSAMDFDIFSSAFYLLSRYEEYRPCDTDSLGRFKASNSYLHKKKLLGEPLVNQWSRKLAEVLKAQYPELEFSFPEFEFSPTMDIDEYWVYKNKGFLRNLASLGKHPNELFKRISVLTGLRKDPVECLTEWAIFFRELNMPSKIFILCAKYKHYGKKTIDNGDPSKSRKFKKEIKDLQRLYPEIEIGLHLSSLSNEETERIACEKKRLQSICSHTIESSRQHFLRLRFPDTFRHLEENGILHDYSLCYAEVPGFRAACCTSFLFYDIEKDEVTKLRIHPTVCMDGTFKNYLKVSPEEALIQMKSLLEKTLQNGGCFRILLHNDSFIGYGSWNAWKSCFADIIQNACSWTNLKK